MITSLSYVIHCLSFSPFFLKSLSNDVYSCTAQHQREKAERHLVPESEERHVVPLETVWT